MQARIYYVVDKGNNAIAALRFDEDGFVVKTAPVVADIFLQHRREMLNELFRPLEWRMLTPVEFENLQEDRGKSI